MPAPVTSEQFVELLRKSNLVDPARLDGFLKAGPGDAQPAQELARELVEAGLLTNFHAEQLLQGKWRGFTIGKYLVLERIGSGGMGSVYLCEHQQMRHRVAVKVLPTCRAADPAALGRFYREARAAGSLDHPNLVRAHDIDQDGELHYLVMDYVDGINLQNLVTRSSGPLAIERACHYIYQAAQGLQHVFEQGLVHRDLKPANLLLDRQGVIRISDLGLARYYDDNQDLLTIKYDDNHVLGTADYVSPEQAMDSHDVDVRTDIYSLGATFWFLLTGKPLFPEGKVAQKLIWHQTREPAPPAGRPLRISDSSSATIQNWN
jgi:serine/threonine protein kinase